MTTDPFAVWLGYMATFGKFASPYSKFYPAPAPMRPIPIFSVTMWDEINVRSHTATTFNHKTAVCGTYRS
jgi:hypothetical protein